MRADRYTKAVLTIIAAALVWLCVRDMNPAVQARAEFQNVSLAGIDDRHPLPVMIVAIGNTEWTEKTTPFTTVTRHLPWQSIEVSR